MPRFAANLTMMFNEVPFIERFALAAKAGFGGVEFLFPYDYEPEVIVKKLKDNNLQVVLFNMPPGDWEAGERGIAAIPGREDEFKQNVDIALKYALAFGTKKLHAMSGIVDVFNRQECEKTFINNFQYAADKLKPHGITLLVEPINTRNMPGYFINHQLDAVKLLEKVDRSNTSVQFDLYHAQIMDGDITRLAEKMLGKFTHIQVASVPDRHEPNQGELNYAHVFDHLDKIGYDGWIGCEYNPKNDTTEGLGWFEAYRTK